MSRLLKFLDHGRPYWLDVDPPSANAVRSVSQYSEGVVRLADASGLVALVDGDLDAVAKLVWPAHFSEVPDGNR